MYNIYIAMIPPLPILFAVVGGGGAGELGS